jgi:hypothetical protein
MSNEAARKFYLEEHARQFRPAGHPYDQLDKYRAQDDLARRRNVPAGYYRDEAQFLDAIRGGGNANRNVQATRRAAAHGLSRMGYGPAALQRALNCSAAELDELLQKPPLAAPHMRQTMAHDPADEPSGVRDLLNRSGDSDGLRTAAVPRRPNAIRRP